MSLRIVVLPMLVLVPAAASLAVQSPTPMSCPVTTPNHNPRPEGSEPFPPGFSRANWHGNGILGTALWPDGKIVFRPGGPGTVLPDGALQMKFLWLKRPGARVTISGHRLDDPSIALRSTVNHDFDREGFLPSHLIFASPGCWKVTATAEGESVSFVASVVKIDNQPAPPAAWAQFARR